MNLKQLLEMPQYYHKEMKSDPHDQMTPFFITDERMEERYTVLAQRDNVVAVIAKDGGNAMVCVRTTRHDGESGVMSYGNLIFKANFKIGAAVDSLQLQAQKVLQVSVVTVVNDDKFKGLASFLYSSLVQAGYTVISDTSHFIGGRQLWKKLARSHLPNEGVYLINNGNAVMDADGKPLEYNGTNVPDADIWSTSTEHEFVLFVYKLR